MNIDFPTAVGLVVLIVQAYSQYVITMMRAEISELKVLIYRDFVTKSEHQNSGNRRG